ncbi:hypothetical protein, partial [Bowmanella yangjiangensis]
MTVDHHFRLFFLLLSLLLHALPTWAGARVVDAVEMAQEPLSLTAQVGVLQDPSRALTVQAVSTAEMARQFQHGLASGASFALGFT